MARPDVYRGSQLPLPTAENQIVKVCEFGVGDIIYPFGDQGWTLKQNLTAQKLGGKGNKTNYEAMNTASALKLGTTDQYTTIRRLQQFQGPHKKEIQVVISQ